MPNFINGDGVMVWVEEGGGVSLSPQEVADLAAYHAFEARQRAAGSANLSPHNLYSFQVTLPQGSEGDFLRELEAQLRGLAARMDVASGLVVVSRQRSVRTTIELPAEIYEVLRRDAEALGTSVEGRLSEMIRLGQRYRFVQPERDRQRELRDMLAHGTMGDGAVL